MSDCGSKTSSEPADRLLAEVYDDLRRLAAVKLAAEPPGQTLQPTALVHEAWLKLGADAASRWPGRAQFLAVAAEAMRRILVDNARRKRALRHGGGARHLDVTELEIATPGSDDELLAVHDALDSFASRYPRHAELVKLRYFAGFTSAEAAGALGLTADTAKHQWTFARAWLWQAIRAG